ncbi:MAG: hypothetical protein EOP84_32780, partial [Verrucomicrobiaceae bacterium]
MASWPRRQVGKAARSHRGGEVAVRASFKDGSGAVLLFAFDGANWNPKVLAASGANAGFAGATWSKFGPPSIGTEGTVAILADVKGGSATKSANSAIVLLSESAASVKIAMEGETNAELGANYKSFSDPVAASDGQIAFTAKLAGGSVSKSNDTALFWRNSVGELVTIARTGTAAPETNGATWKKLINFALPSGDTAGPIILAEIGGSGVARKSNLGLWARNSSGTLTLLARAGFPLSVNGVPMVVSKLALLNPLPPVHGSTRSFNDAGRVVYLATFKDGTQAIMTAR